MAGLQPDSPPLPTARSRRISNVKACPNWQLISREGLSDDEFTGRYLMLSVVRAQMLKSPRRRLIPEYAWEELVDFAILRAVTTWKGNGDGKCPLKNYAWILLGNTAIQWWNKNKVGIIDSVELDRSYMEGNG